MNYSSSHPRTPPRTAGPTSPSPCYPASQSPSLRYSPQKTRATSPLSRNYSPQAFRSASPNYSTSDYRRSPTPRTTSPHPRAISPLPSNLEIAIPPGAQLPVSKPSITSIHQGPESNQFYKHHPLDTSLSPPPAAYVPGKALRPTSPATAASGMSPKHSPGYSPTGSPARSTRSATSRQIPPASTVQELGRLWDAAQGVVTEEKKPGDGSIYILNMYRQAPNETPEVLKHPFNFPETFTFGPNPQTPFYSIIALPDSPYDTNHNELLVTRKNPSTGQDVSIVTMGLEPPSRRISPGGDGLITLIYPKLAVLHAMEATAAMRSEEETWSNKDPSSLVKEAVLQAEKECCRLVWSREKGRYYLYHPGVNGTGNVYLVDIEGEVGFDTLGARGRIKLIDVDTNELLAALDFSRNLLIVNTTATSRIPSRYIIDVAVSTVLTVATVEGRRIRTYLRSISQASKRERDDYEHPRCFSPWEMVVGVTKGAIWLVWFTVGLGVEIIKAIFDAFRKD